MHSDRLREMEQNFAFCEWELYGGTDSEQKAKSTKQRRNSMFLRCFLNAIARRVVGDADPYDGVITIMY